MRPVQQVAEPPHVPPVPTHGDTHTPAVFRTSPAQHSEPLRAATPLPAQVDRQVSVALVVVPTQYGLLAQHGVDDEPQSAPEDRHVGATSQKPD